MNHGLDWLGRISKNPYTWPVVGGLLVILAAIAMFIARRRRQAQENDMQEEEIQESDMQEEEAPVLPVDAAEHDVDQSDETATQTDPESEQVLAMDVSGLAEPDVTRDQEQAGTAVPNLAEKIDFNLDLDSGNEEVAETAPPALQVPANPVATVAANEVKLDLPEQAAARNVPISQDEVLELDLPPVNSTGNAVNTSNTPAEVETAFSVEMNMKLDLAAAYQEIGDTEGARELLDEVIKGGNEELAIRAREMLTKLS